MSGMAGALPDFQSGTHSHHSPQSQPRFPPGGTATASLGFQAQPMSQFAGQTPINPQGFSSYLSQFATPYQQAAAVATAQAYEQQQSSHQPHQGGPGSNQPPYNTSSFFPGHQQQQFVYYPGQYGPGGLPQQGVQGQPGPIPSSYGRGPNQSHGQTGEGDVGAMGGRFPVYGGQAPTVSTPYSYGLSGAGRPSGPGQYTVNLE